MPRRLSLVLVLVAVVLSGGCGTLDNIKRPTFPPPKKPDAKVVRVYGGVRGDFVIMTQYDWNRTASYLDYAFIPLLAVLDLALDVAGDTITLPYTAVAELRRATRRPNATPDPTDPANAPTLAPGPTPLPPGAVPSPPPAPAPAPPLNTTPVSPSGYSPAVGPNR
jgi:hypothetical protein